MLTRLLQFLAPYRALEESARTFEHQLSVACEANKGLAQALEEKAKALEERSKLTLQDLSLSAVDQVSLKNMDEFQRAALFHACEIIRLCNYNEHLRNAVVQVRDLLMEQTKNEKTNLLPHEKPEDLKDIQAKIAEKSKKIPALPRFDNQ